jgi:type II secretory pathway component PulF
MAVFAYKAMDGLRAASDGTIAADTPRQARELLRARGLSVQDIRALGAKTTDGVARWRFKNRHTAQLATAVRELSTLLGAGIPLLDAMKTVSQQQRGRFRASLLLLRDRVAAGVGLAEAMGEQPDVFDPLCIQMVEVGENSGTLETVLDQWADFKERSLQLKDRVMTALMYPAFVVLVGVLVTVFLMTYVIPMLLSSLIEAGRPLPWPTKIVKAASDLLTGHTLALGIVVGVLAVGIIAIFQTSAGKRMWCRTVLRMPLFGPMAQKQGIARISMIVATLLKSGIEFVHAIDVTARSTSNLLLREALEHTALEVGAGRDIGASLERTGVFTPMAVQIFAVGQESGRLEEMLERLAADYDRQVARTSDRLTAALEPVFILTLAVFVGFLLFATILPILEAGNVT